MNYQNNLVELDIAQATVQGREFAIEDRETGRVFLTNKHYINKLFFEMGFRNRNVIVILEDFAGKIVSDIGKLNTSKLYIDDTTDSFIVTSENSINWVNSMFEQFNTLGYKIVDIKYSDSYHEWDEVVVETPTGVKFAVYINMYEEEANLLLLSFSNTTLSALSSGGVFKFNEDNSLTSMMSTIQSYVPAPSTVSSGFNYTTPLSPYEYFDLLQKIGYVKKKRKTGVMYLTDEGIDATDISSTVEPDLEEYNLASWLQKHTGKLIQPFTFRDACELISRHLIDHMIWEFKDIYLDNVLEKSDYFAINN